MTDPNLLHQLPEGLRDCLPREAGRIVQAQRRLAVRFALWGYSPILPPSVEFMDTFLAGSPHWSPQHLLKFEDRTTGRLLAYRPDFTPQIARIASTVLSDHPLPWRLRYSGSVLRHRAEADREMRQVGVELIGWAGIEADGELMAMLMDGLDGLGIEPLTLAIGHPGLFGGLAKAIGLDEAQRDQLRDLLHAKDKSGLGVWREENQVQETAAEAISLIGTGYGSLDELEKIAKLLEEMAGSKAITGSAGLDEAQQAVGQLREVIELLSAYEMKAEIQIDPAELSSFEYHSGITFNVYHPESPRAIAGGGRYDRLLGEYGAPCPASGFAIDLQTATALSKALIERPSVELIVYNEGGEATRKEANRVAARMRTLGWRVVKRMDGAPYEETVEIANVHGAIAIVCVGAQPDKMIFKGVGEEIEQSERSIQEWLSGHPIPEIKAKTNLSLQDLLG